MCQLQVFVQTTVIQLSPFCQRKTQCSNTSLKGKVRA